MGLYIRSYCPLKCDKKQLSIELATSHLHQRSLRYCWVGIRGVWGNFCNRIRGVSDTVDGLQSLTALALSPIALMLKSDAWDTLMRHQLCLIHHRFYRIFVASAVGSEIMLMLNQLCLRHHWHCISGVMDTADWSKLKTEFEEKKS